MRLSPATVGVPFVRALATHGDRPAVIDPDGTTLTYSELADRVAAVGDQLGTGRRLVLVEASNAVDPLVTYLAALYRGHPVLLAAPDARDRVDALVAAYDPDVVCAAGPGGWQVRARRAGSVHDLHEDLALLLSTSGSTGSPKLVRLSAGNIEANADAIARYLDIRDTDRAATSLPLHYCYGLSVVHSNLLRGAALLLSDRSVADPAFWSAFRAQGGTSLHGVPHTFDLLDRTGFEHLDLPDLRYVTQAGGRLPADRVLRFAELGRRAGWQLFVMYGQTEATARMAYLPPELAAAHPCAIGVPVPGGSFRLDPGPDEGELVYEGPNVMLGYAQGPADLALGRTVDALATGDLARRNPDGLYEVVGRRSRFLKLYGVRVDLDGVERILAAEGVEAVCAGTDDALVIAVRRRGSRGGGRTGHEHRIVAGALGLPPSCVHVHPVEDFPRLPTGKTDHAAVTRLDTTPARPRRRCPGSLRRSQAPSVRRVVAGALGTPGIDDAIDRGATFTELGGDSLSYVEVSIELERILGHLPDDWPTRPLRELDRPAVPRRSLTRVETGVALRALAIVLVVGSHVGLFQILGGAHLLLVLAGWSFARFVLPTDGSPASRRIVRVLIRLAVPCVLWIGLRAVGEDDVDLINALLLNYVLDPSAWGYWFVEVLAQTFVVLAVLFAVPAVRRAQARYPFGFAAALLVGALAARALVARTNEFVDLYLATDMVLWLFVLGWLAQRADSTGRRVLVATATVLLVPGFFDDPVREAVVAGGLLLVLSCAHIVVPRAAARPIGLTAGASLYVYLTHYAVYPPLLGHLPDAAVVAACLVAGIGTWLGIEAGRRRVGRRRVGRRRVARQRRPVLAAVQAPPKNRASPSTVTLTSCPTSTPPSPATRLRTV